MPYQLPFLVTRESTPVKAELVGIEFDIGDGPGFP